MGVESTQKISNCIDLQKRLRKNNLIMKLKYFYQRNLVVVGHGQTTNILKSLNIFLEYFYQRNLVVRQKHFISCSDTDKQPPQKPLLSWTPTRILRILWIEPCYPNIFWAKLWESASTCRHFSWISIFQRTPLNFPHQTEAL